MTLAEATIPATALRTIGGWVEYDRCIGTCKACKTTFAVTDTTVWRKIIRPCPTCSTQTALDRVSGVKSDKKCDARCQNAKRGECECSCGGENHGCLR